MKLIIGSYVSFSKDKQLIGCVDEAIQYGGNTFMFYTGAPQNTLRLAIDNLKTAMALKLMEKQGINYHNVVVHAPYIINLASDPQSTNHQFAISFMKQEIKRCEKLGVTKLIIHPGNHLGHGIENGIKNIIKALNMVIEPNQKVFICLEMMSGKGTECGSNFSEIQKIISGVKYSDCLLVCFDTCHMSDAGYDLSDFDIILDDFDKTIGLSKLCCIHLNDSKNIIGSKKDRHENIGLGMIGFDTLIRIIYNERVANIPKILETPYITGEDISKEKIYPPYRFEIEMIKNKKYNNNLIPDIRNYYKKTK
jgi:deoxyribonuclease IV